MADGDSGIEGELGNHSEDTNAAEVPKENGQDEEQHVGENLENHHEDTGTGKPTEEEDNRPVVELFVKVLH